MQYVLRFVTSPNTDTIKKKKKDLAYIEWHQVDLILKQCVVEVPKNALDRGGRLTPTARNRSCHEQTWMMHLIETIHITRSTLHTFPVQPHSTNKGPLRFFPRHPLNTCNDNLYFDTSRQMFWKFARELLPLSLRQLWALPYFWFAYLTKYKHLALRNLHT